MLIIKDNVSMSMGMGKKSHGKLCNQFHNRSRLITCLIDAKLTV
jgi:hypothetical protein